MAAELRIAIAGAGRMGKAIAALIEGDPTLELTGIWSRGGDLDSLVSAADVVIDFSLPEGTAEVVAAIERHQKPLVCGVSGLGDAQLAAIEQAAQRVAVVYDRNMSQGIAVLAEMLRHVAAALGDQFSVRIEETHHIHKKDAPSGTALMLGEVLAEARGVDAVDIDYRSERRGEVPGDHTVIFSASSEELALSHSVTTRDVFAAGALRAARWIVSREAGRYAMHDVLFGNKSANKSGAA